MQFTYGRRNRIYFAVRLYLPNPVMTAMIWVGVQIQLALSMDLKRNYLTPEFWNILIVCVEFLYLRIALRCVRHILEIEKISTKELNVFDIACVIEINWCWIIIESDIFHGKFDIFYAIKVLSFIFDKEVFDYFTESTTGDMYNFIVTYKIYNFINLIRIRRDTY